VPERRRSPKAADVSADTLFDVGPVDENTLTERQRAVLRAARSPEGVDPRQAGHAAHAAAGCKWCRATEPCRYAESDGNTILRRLRELGLVRYRAKLKTWHATTGRATSQNTGADPFPAGF
jgi:hypothetical protein